MSKIFIDPSSRIFYSSYYIKGLYDFFGKKNVHFSGKYFNTLKRSKTDFSYQHFFAFVHVSSSNKITKFVIDFCDPFDIHENAYDWCDFYGKINLNYELINPVYLDKILLIPPSFGIRIWNFRETLLHCFRNYVFYRPLLLVSFKQHLKDYYLQYKRLRIEDYENHESNGIGSNPFIFMIGTLWEDENSMKFTNSRRKEFVEICKQKECLFEGGFFSNGNHKREYQDLVFNKQYTTSEYVAKTKRSQFVFNTPAVHDCHGWKLGEYMAIGKAVISTPFVNEIPDGLSHMENIYFVSTKPELENAIDFLLDDTDFCLKLAENLKEYYTENVKPVAVIKKIASLISTKSS